MRVLKNLTAVLIAAVLVTGCATVKTDSWQNCALAGAAIGGAAGGFGDDHDRSDLIVSAIGGAVIGGTVCALMADDVEVVVADADNDGVVDSLDECPTTPEGVAVDSKGCALDSDNDGVADYKDQCPNSAAGAVVNELGCAKALVLEGVNFHTNSADLTEEAKGVLHQIATAHHEHHGEVNLLISGHTDSQGAAAYNQSLSQKRAEAVVAFMIEHGCDASKLTAVGHGESQAIADNATKEGRAKNRRVELSVK
ncbi:MAG: haloacid dehalogenase [Cycloclasticus sp. symbiont of Bathymodiolus heckerae]|nr:MAG: haloacid dehalogenase [Cycloclasticus sp. symbiont of Bathymodiolus heckerae]